MDAALPPLAPSRRRRRCGRRRRPRSAAPSTCAPTASKGTATSASRPRARSSCARGARRCSPTGCSTTSPRTRSGPRATSRCARASTGSAGPRSSSSASARSATSTSRASTSPRTQSRGEAKEIRFAGPDLYEATQGAVHDLRGAQQRLVPARRRDRGRQAAQGRHGARRERVLPRRARDVHAVARVPAVQRAQVGLPHADDRIHADPRLRVRGAVLLQPRAQLRRDADAAHHDAARRADRAARAATCSSRAAGEVIGEIVPDDRIDRTTRAGPSSWKHNQQFAPWLAGYVNYNRVSDDTYLADFSDRIAVTSQKTLPQEAGLNRDLRAVHVLARVQAVPDAAGSQSRRVRDAAVQHAAAGEGGDDRVRLARPHLERHSPSTCASRRSRSIADRRSRDDLSVDALDPPGQRVVRQRARGVAAWQYDLNQPTPGVPDGSAGVAVPIASLDGGLIFERDWSIFGRNFVQTLEPRAMYTYIPFRNQNQLPVFDTVLDDFNFTQLFSENRFIGGDRVGDTNQLALAVTSRLLDPATGAERFRFAVGQRFYFEDQQVYLPGTTPQKAGSSDFLVGAEGRLLDAWSLIGLAAVRLRHVAARPLQRRHALQPRAGQGAEPHLPLLAGTRRPGRRSIASSSRRTCRANGRCPTTGRSSARGTTRFPDRKTLEAVVGAGVQWRVLGVARRRTAVDHDDGDANQLDLRAARAQRTGARGNESPRAPAAHGSRVSAHQRSGDQAARPQLRSPARILGRESMHDRWHCAVS